MPFFNWENGIGFLGTGMPEGGNGKENFKMGLGYINCKKNNEVSVIAGSVQGDV